MTDLVQFVIDAHGGMDRFERFSTLTARLHQAGALWAVKGQPTTLQDAHVQVDLKREWTSHWPFAPTQNRSVFTPEHVELVDEAGIVLDALDDPRSTFRGSALETPWSALQLAYFAGYTMWTYLTSPFLFRHPGVRTEEIEPWLEKGERWRRLQVVFPDAIATHCSRQVFHIDDVGMIRRHDYEVDILEGSVASRYLYRPVEAQGLTFYSKMRIYPRLADNNSNPDLLLVSIDLSDFKLK